LSAQRRKTKALETQTEVLKRFCRGQRKSEIARELEVSTATVYRAIDEAFGYFRDRQAETIATYHSEEWAKNEEMQRETWKTYESSRHVLQRLAALNALSVLQRNRLRILEMVAPQQDESSDIELVFVEVQSREELDTLRTAEEQVRVLTAQIRGR